MAKLRLSAHNLKIDTGRFGKNRLHRTERICEYCKTLGTDVLQDEQHFLLSCQLFSDERKIMLKVARDNSPSINELNESNLFIWLTSQEDPRPILAIAIFTKTSFKKKEQSRKRRKVRARIISL